METALKTTQALAQLVRRARKAQKMTQEELAGLTGTGCRFISDLEHGKETAQLGKTLLVLSALGIALSAVYTWDAA